MAEAKKHHKRPLKATDKRRLYARSDTNKVTAPSGNGSASPVARLFNDRRGPNGKGKRAA